jgi:hypothetical protein
MTRPITKRLRSTLLCLALAVSAAGCAMCHTEFDDTYAAYGGIRERQDRMHGRVGSILSDPAMQMAEPGGMSDTPTEEDLYRDQPAPAGSVEAEEI